MSLIILLAIGALALSGVAAYYSIVGLAAIYAASKMSIIIMGAIIEYCKVVSVAWLHLHWDTAPKKLIRGVTTCVFIAMVVTSVGVFGFLSKAHTGQTAASDESIAQVARIKTEVLRRQDVIERAELKISQLQNSGATIDSSVQDQIDQEQVRIDSAYERTQPAIDEQNNIIAGQTKLYQKQIDTINADLTRLQNYIDDDEVKKAQQLIGETSLGGWGPLTAETARLWKLERTDRKAALFEKIEDASQNNATILAARKEISRLRTITEEQIAQSNALINRLRGKLGNAETADNVDQLLDDQYERISASNAEIEKLTTERYELEAEFRQLEADVGPLKFVAELVFSETDRTMLEKAVRGITIMILLVLDPFAIFLILAVTYSLGDKFKLRLKQKTAVNEIVEIKPDPINTEPTVVINPEPIPKESTRALKAEEELAEANSDLLVLADELERQLNEQEITKGSDEVINTEQKNVDYTENGRYSATTATQQKIARLEKTILELERKIGEK